MIRILFVAICLSSLSLAVAAEPDVVRPFESIPNPPPWGQIDRLVFGQLDEMGIERANLCSDAVFVRRVYLDTIGTLPTADESRQFILDRNRTKRRQLIEELLQRDEFADYWTMKWCDVLRVKSEFPINLWPNAVQAYHRWIRTSIKNNMPYDQFARELLTSSGSNFRVPQVNFYRAVETENAESITEATALVFMGQRTANWPSERLDGMARFFEHLGYKSTAEWKEEIVFFDPFKTDADGNSTLPCQAIFPDGTKVELPKDQDSRAIFANWLIQAENPWFAKTAVNRIWYWLLGRGIIHEPDDIRPDNPPSNPKLLAHLERELIDSDYDLKHVYRLILNSATYQLSSIPKSNIEEAAANFAFYPVRRLDAEVLTDALCQITGTTEEYWSPIPEPFSIIPEDQRSIALADGSITSSFLELFGRPPRDTGLLSERNNRPTASQRLHLLNSSHIRRKIEQIPRSAYRMRNRNPREALAELYLKILSRFPTPEELETVGEYARSDGVNQRDVYIDLAWALVNSPEFQYHH